MIWDRVAPLYDLAVNTLNRRVYYGTGSAVARLIRPGDTVLECACGTGTITAAIAPACARVVATDYSEGMLKQAGKKLARHPNVVVEQADITHLRYADDSFDAVVAATSFTCCLNRATRSRSSSGLRARAARSLFLPT